MSDDILIAAVVIAVMVGIYLLRHVIVLAIRLVILAVLVLWVWEHRGEIIDAAAPYLGAIGDLLEQLGMSGMRDLLVDLLSDQ